ncbi:30S ribosomal protein S12 methylthiotransferase RimO [Chloroflexus sp. MS-CIW-1]|jgi:ribosomal protein S12 methylthiotransferase|uniref:30S ribosomal protein S12 methylthiotransferase RimO n=1 Tax=Chloroflexus sp. MS-CIW-1 TaxID=3055768 RepID=UPI001B15DC44|nr:30S ribosomal protein S12 methylthiotransferase RimO [Chloroflexus sp. MS-CIW-1]MBO9347211.1 30S ribosomal protein S12 methylthiotransferase RimO [Chloroflexus sp.]MDN5271103.1 30S ribosomal protein S12 methylthiotransferase RimO [Chloroflexus sp. MS-CIW-1]
MKYHIVTLGCPKNVVDSEGMDGLLSMQGHQAVASADEADVVIVNTCSFIAAARSETLSVLKELASRKQPHQRLIAAGCMAQSHPQEITAVQGVDATIGTQQWTQINALVSQLDQPVIPLTPGQTAVTIPLIPTSSNGRPTSYADWRTTQIRRTRHTPSAYLKISDGCNLRCAFCTIPSFKGDMRSKPVGAVLAEAQELVAQGTREIILVAQHLTDYGRDLGLKDGLAMLLDELCQVLPTDIWIRLMYAYPHGISERLITTMATHKQICHYLDMPLQHAHPATLRRMRRPPDTDRTLKLIAELRAAMPDIALRSTFIVGYPGETTAEFNALLEFLQTAQLDRVGAFRYSREPGTPAAELPDQVRPQVIERRWHELMRLQQQISFARNQRWIGRTLTVLIEGNGSADDGSQLSVGRSFRDAPEIDGQVFVWGHFPIGQIITVRITQAAEYDLWGEAVG